MKRQLPPPARYAIANRRPPSRIIRTLLADDTPLFVTLLARIASMDDRVSIVGSAEDGCRTIGSARSLQPDLVITDLHMPGLDGAEATGLLKGHANPPIVFVATSDDTSEARARCMAAGADAFLVKSGNLAPQLLSAIKQFFPETIIDPEHLCDGITTTV